MRIRKHVAAAAAAVAALAIASPVTAGLLDASRAGRTASGATRSVGEAPTPLAEPGRANTQAERSPFTRVEVFATKTGFRGVVAWSARQPVVPIVRYGASPKSMNRIAPVADVPDTAGMAYLEGLTVGRTYYVSIEDQRTGVATAPRALRAVNAYKDRGPNRQQPSTQVSYKPRVYTIDLVVQLDSQSLPAGIPSDVALGEIAAGINVLAERLYDALDGHVRLGKVLVTDTVVAGAGTTPLLVPLHAPGTCETPTNVADILVTTAEPFESATFRYAIAERCTPIYLGRIGQLVVPWEDDLHFGYTAAHELLHYAFGAPDLYSSADLADPDAGGCRNLAWDGSLMHNNGGWRGGIWELTEVDRDARLTPCAHGAAPYTWDQIRSRYKAIPDGRPLEDVRNRKPRGNPDGGALRIMVLDREPGASRLRSYRPSDANPEARSQCPAASTRTSFRDRRGDARLVFGDPVTNEPALDLLAERVAYRGDRNPKASSGDRLRFELTLDDLRRSPPPGTTGEWLDVGFSVDGVGYTIEAIRARGARPQATLVHPSGWSARLRGGSWNASTDVVTLDVPGVVRGDDGRAHPVLVPGKLVGDFESITRRYVSGLGVASDDASGGCLMKVPGTPPAAAKPPIIARLSKRESFARSGVIREPTVAYSCSSINDPVCVEYRVVLEVAGTLDLSITTDLPAEDYDLLVFDDRGRTVAELAEVGTVVESGSFRLRAGTYTVQVQPYAVGPESPFTVRGRLR